MLKSLYSGVSGVRSNQTKLDVTGNNISNVNTTAYKSSRVNFKDMLSQTLKGANAPSDTSGGLNAKQVGLGVSTGSITSDMKQGTLNETGRPTDLAIEGDGYYIVSDKNKIDVRYTRDGSFTLDRDGNLVTSDGFYVQGKMEATPKIAATSGTSSSTSSSSDVTQLDLGGFKFGLSNYLNGWSIKLGTFASGTATSTTVDTTTKSITINADFNNTDWSKRVTAEALNDSINTELSKYGSNIPAITVEGIADKDVTGTPSVTLSTTLNNPYEVSVGGFNFNLGSGLDGWKVKVVTAASGTATSADIDVDNKTIEIKGDFANATATSRVKAQDLQTKINSMLVSYGYNSISVKGIPVSTTAANDTSATASGDTSNSGGSSSVGPRNSELSQINIPSSITVGGVAQKLVDYSIEKDGTIKAVYGDQTYVVGKMILAKFVNPSGLTAIGGNTFKQSLNSGAPENVYAGTLGNGQIRQGMLEMSNVDLAGEMTDMLVTSRAFQANSKVITTSDEMLQELLNLKR